MSNPLQPGPLAGGMQGLVGALLGGRAAEAAARQKEELRLRQVQTMEAGLDKKMTDALLARDKRKAQQSYEADMVAAGHDPMGAKLLSSLLIGGHGAQIDNVQKYDMRADAVPAFQSQGFTLGNALMAAVGGKPVSDVDIDAGHVIEDRFGAAPTVQATTETQSKIVENNAQANASDALAWRRRNQPLSSGGGGRGGGRSGGGGRPTLANMPPGSERPTAADAERLLSDPKMYGSSFIRRFGTAAYEAALEYRPKHREAKKMKPGTRVPDAPRDPKKRTTGTLYMTPKGALRWMGTGWSDK